ncbi:MAG TPA: GNAT family N-acetyltransferase [Chitinophagales bacterium]|nr:GNAT family N-acetyltransferase [Chitinophagales bacterium]
MIRIAESDDDILKCRRVLCELRPHLKEEFFLEAVRQTLADNRLLIFIEAEGIAVSASVFEWGYNLYPGKYIYIDDLSTLPQARGKGHASQLLDWIIDYAEEKKFDQVHLDSGVNAGRFDAHRLYHNKRFNVTSLHFALKVR